MSRPCEKCSAPTQKRLCRECRVEHASRDPDRVIREHRSECLHCGDPAEGYGEPGETVCTECAGDEFRPFEEVSLR